jgi:hypothetical protein
MSSDSIDNNGFDDSPWIRTVKRAVARLSHGSVEVVVHDGRVVQVETREKVRFADGRRPEPRRRNENDIARTDRNPGGAASTHEETEE